ncbi:CRAL/TRIO domain-containing protein [Mycena sanguinolenta]|uniref:CRAL/TRIO domain-containing protein n=1 Tax=Mycena sanguinolenta TaxID=230812 RepID=A0A8H6YER8_9AGAR|nr:CRAL/TRIO domain-containing protein [Mycena sanguinolenta]
MGDAAYNVFAGHLGHLSVSQEEALAAFKRALTEEKLYDPAEPALDDPTLLRFLRARSFDPAGALKQFSDSVKWRREHDVDNLFTTFDPAEFENSRRYYPRWTDVLKHSLPHDFAQNGMPVYVYNLASLDSAIQKELHSAPPERRYQRIIALYESMIRFNMPLCSFLPHATATPITSVVTIIDLGNVSISSMWTLRSHLSESAKLATANYPETLSTIAIGWFDPGTRNKIHILGKNPAETLLKLIDAENLPSQYGGTLDWKFFSEPNLDDATKEAIGELPKGPHIFVNGL